MLPSPSLRRPAPAWKKAALLAGSVLFALGLAEGALRVYFWSKGIGRKDVREILARSKSAELPEIHGGAGLFGLLEPSDFPEVVYQVKPFLKGRFRHATLSTNRFGMRGPDVTVAKPDHTVRIVGIGDSHMFGWGVDQGKEYLAVLEGMLDAHAESGWRFQVLNFAAPGYDTVMEVGTYEHRAQAFDPDVVLVHFVGNDLSPPHFLAPPPGFAPSHWYVVELVRGLFGSSAEEEESEMAVLAGESEESANHPREGSRRSYENMAGAEPFVAALERLAALTAPKHIPVIFFELGESTQLRRFARDQGLAHGFRFLDPLPTFYSIAAERGQASDGKAFRRLFVGLDDHPNALGHEAYARALYCEFQAMHLAHLEPTPDLCRLSGN